MLAAIVLALVSCLVYLIHAGGLFFSVLILLTFILMAGVVFIYIFVFHFITKSFNSGYGLNPGSAFYSWIETLLTKEGIQSVSGLIARQKLEAQKIKLRIDHPLGLQEIGPRLSIIASDITTQAKVEFPLMAGMYWPDQEAGDVNPAQFVRASMSIPFFFKAHAVKISDPSNALLREEWKKQLNYTGPIPLQALFVDGGLLSNFPINIFYNPKVEIARMPTLGILLEDEDFKPKDQFDSLGSFVWAMVNTLRYNYDKDFMLKHNDFEKTIGRIDVKDFNWLKFNLTEKEKEELFRKGAEAARDFIRGFDWENYKLERRKMTEALKK